MKQDEILAIIVEKTVRTDGWYSTVIGSNGDIEYDVKIWGDGLYHSPIDSIEIAINSLRIARGNENYIIAQAK
jgi:hypothetical protein